jgi:hypothetical protein
MSATIIQSNRTVTHGEFSKRLALSVFFEERPGNQLRGEPRERRSGLKATPAVALRASLLIPFDRPRRFPGRGHQDFALSGCKGFGGVKAIFARSVGSFLEPKT